MRREEWWVMNDEWGVYPIAPGGSTLLICLPLGARLATNVEQTPDASLGTHHSPLPPLSVPEGRSFLKDNINNKNNMLDSMLSKLSVLFFLRQPFFVLTTTETTKTTRIMIYELWFMSGEWGVFSVKCLVFSEEWGILFKSFKICRRNKFWEFW